MEKFMCMCRLSPKHRVRRLDVLSVAWNSFGAALIYFTGNSYFNRDMRKRADSMQLKLGNDGLYRTTPTSKGREKTEMIAGRTEKEVFDMLRYEWRDPEDRNL